MTSLAPTCDPYVWIEEQSAAYIRYRQVSEPNNADSPIMRRWEQFGICDGQGSCWTGAVGPEPTLDCPNTPELVCECRTKAADPLMFNELGLTP